MTAYEWTVTIDGSDVSDLVMAAGTIDYGRQGAGDGFTAPFAEFDMFTETGFPQYAGTWPTLDVGLDVTIHVTWDGVTQWRRFTGRIQALDLSRDMVHVTCAGNTVDFQDFTAGATNAFYPRTVETDYDRVTWLVDGAPTAVTLEGSAARRVRQIDRNTPAQPLLDHILRVADDCDGLFMEDRLGVPRYRTRNFTLPAAYTLPADVVQSDGLQLSKDRGDQVSTVRVWYGEPDPATGLQQTASDTNGTLAAAFGFDKAVELVTDLRTPEAAAGRAAQYLLQHGDVWVMPDVPLMMNLASGAEADDILDLQEGWLVTVPNLPTGWPITSYDGRVVGFTEIMHPSDYIMVLHLEPALTVDSEADDDPIYPDGIVTGYDATTTETTGGKTYRWCRWDATGSFTVDHTDAVYTRVVGVAGGGGGGASPGGSQGAGGGGGGGGFMDEFLDLNPGTWPVTIGAGGSTSSGNGGDTVLYGTRLYGGGYGGNGTNPDGGDGGSGGGASFNRATNTLTGTPGTGVVGQGYDGSRGGGGSAGAATSGGSFAGGAGTVVSTPWGSVTLGAGGEGTGATVTPTAGTGSGGQGGYIAAAPSAGARGSVYFRYRIG